MNDWMMEDDDDDDEDNREGHHKDRDCLWSGSTETRPAMRSDDEDK